MDYAPKGMHPRLLPLSPSTRKLEFMAIPPSRPKDSSGWQPLYRAAILESDLRSVEHRFLTAEKAIAVRLRELPEETGEPFEVEREAMDDALYTPRALRNAEAGQSSTAA